MLLPYASDRPPRNPPLAVVGLVLVNFAVFGLVALVISVRGPQAPVLWFANLGLVPGVPHWYAFLTYAFLHDDIFHVSANMLFLWVFGSSVEDALGWKRFLGLYLGAVAVTGALQFAVERWLPGMDPMAPVVGASGAVAAVVGVFAVRFYRARIRFIGLPIRVPAVALLLVALLAEMAATVIQLVHRTAGGAASVAHWAHIGGFVLGMGIAQATRQFAAGRHEYLAEDAAALTDQGSPLAAARRLEAVLRVQPANRVAEAELGRAWGAAGDRDAAARHYLSAIAAMLASGESRVATARYLEALRYIPGFTLAPRDQLTLAGAFEDQGAYRDASHALQSLRRAAPSAPEAEMAHLRVAALALNRLNDRERAVRELRDFLARYPASSWRTYAEDLLRGAGVQSEG